MAKHTFGTALAMLEKGKVVGSYLMIGDNYYQRYFLTELILKDKIPPGQRAYNKTEVGGQKASPQVLEESLFSVPLLGGNVVVVVTDLNRVSDKGQALLMKAIPRLDPSITFVGSAKKLDGRKALTKTLSQHCTVVELKEISNSKLPDYIKGRFTASGIAVDREGIIEMCRVVGRDCGEIEHEVEKALIYFGADRSLKLEDIKSLLSSSRHYSRYEVANYLGSKQIGRALASLREVLSSGGSEARGLLWGCYQQIERMLAYRRHGKTMRREDLAGMLRMSSYFVNELARQTEKWSGEELIRALLTAYRAEVAERFTSQPRQQIWERAFIEILQQRGE